MHHVVRTLAAIRFALSTRRDFLLEMLALRHQVAVLARSNRRFRPSDRLLWLILRRVWPRWRDALVLVQPATVDRWHRDPSFAAGGAVRDALDDHASIRRVAISLGAWLRRIGFGARREFTANCSSSESSSQNARCRVTCENGRRGRHRTGAHLSRITSASSNSIPKCCHRTCRAMTSSTRLHSTSRSILSDRLPAPRQCALLDGNASARRVCLALPCTQDHRHDRTGMRRSAGRAPPGIGLLAADARRAR